MACYLVLGYGMIWKLEFCIGLNSTWYTTAATPKVTNHLPSYMGQTNKTNIQNGELCPKDKVKTFKTQWKSGFSMSVCNKICSKKEEE